MSSNIIIPKQKLNSLLKLEISDKITEKYPKVVAILKDIWDILQNELSNKPIPRQLEKVQVWEAFYEDENPENNERNLELNFLDCCAYITVDIDDLYVFAYACNSLNINSIPVSSTPFGGLDYPYDSEQLINLIHNFVEHNRLIDMENKN